MKLYAIYNQNDILTENSIYDYNVSYKPCYKNMKDLLDQEPNELEKYSSIYIINTISKTSFEPDKKVCFVSRFKIQKKLSGKELVDEYIKNCDPTNIYGKFLDVIFESKDLTDEDIQRLANWLMNNFGLRTIFKYERINNNIMVNIFNDLCEKYSLHTTVLSMLVSDMLNNQNLSNQMLDRILNILLKDNFNIISFIKDKRVTVEMYDKIIANILDYELWSEMLKNPQMTNELLNKMVWKIITRSRDVDRVLSVLADGYKLLFEIISHPLCDNEMYKNIVSRCLFLSAGLETEIHIKIIKRENVSEEVLDMILMKSLLYYNSKILFELIEADKLTSNQLERILNIPKDIQVIEMLIKKDLVKENQISKLLFSANSPSFYSLLIKTTKLTLEQFEYILNKSDDRDVITLALNNPLIEMVIEKLKQQIIISGDINLFKKLYLIEDTKLNNQAQNQSTDSELPSLDYKCEKSKLLNEYLLKYNMLNIRLFIIEEIHNMGYLSKENMFDKKYIPTCPRSLKICHLMQELEDRKKEDVVEKEVECQRLQLIQYSNEFLGKMLENH